MSGSIVAEDFQVSQASRSALRQREGEAAVSDVLGSVLLVAMTVGMAVALGALLFAFDGPRDTQHTRLAVSLDPGSGGWGTGDESIRVAHMGGEVMRPGTTTVRYTIGTTTTEVTGNALLSAFSDGKFVIGETWIRTQSMTAGAEVAVQVVASSGGQSQLLTGAFQVAGGSTFSPCSSDITPPSATLITQNPSDVTTLTVGSVTVSVTVADTCSGVKQSVSPHLLWKTTSATFTDTGAMSSIGTNQWQGTIPAQTWLLLGGQTLSYQITTMTDNNGNAGSTAVQTDVITTLVTYTYPVSSGATTTIGTVTNYANARSASDSLAVATLTEAATSTSTSSTLTFNAPTTTTGVTQGASGNWVNLDKAGVTDLQYANTGSVNNPSWIQFPLADPSTTTGTITSVVLKATGGQVLGSNDGWTFTPVRSGTVGTVSSTIPITAVDSTFQYDITSLRPGGGTWAWTDITNLESRISPVKVASAQGTWRIDRAWVEVTYSTPVPYALDVQFLWSGVPSASTQTVELSYSVSSPGDTFQVQVWNGATWRTCSGTLTATTLTSYTCALTVSTEYQGGAPRVRFVDVTPTGTTQGILSIEYARVASL